jgi:hypothetical protein
MKRKRKSLPNAALPKIEKNVKSFQSGQFLCLFCNCSLYASAAEGLVIRLGGGEVLEKQQH